jgi:hypothetical protein
MTLVLHPKGLPRTVWMNDTELVYTLHDNMQLDASFLSQQAQLVLDRPCILRVRP